MSNFPGTAYVLYADYVRQRQADALSMVGSNQSYTKAVACTCGMQPGGQQYIHTLLM